MGNADWDRLIAQLRRGECTPFLGAGACGKSVPTGAKMSRKWATEYKYPFKNKEDLARVMEYAASKHDATYVKEIVCKSIQDAEGPNFADPAEPHALLAEFPLPVFITTNYDDFLSAALTRSGKHPESAMCCWYKGAKYDSDFFEAGPGFNPTESQPIIYHLHGRIQDPKSIVLTESDYLEFLVRIVSSRDGDALRLIPTAILSALTDRPLLFVGYSLQDWTFRVIYQGLHNRIPGIHLRRSVSVQLPPPVNQPKAEAEARAKEFLARYFDGWRISIFWGTATDFCNQLRSRMP